VYHTDLLPWGCRDDHVWVQANAAVGGDLEPQVARQVAGSLAHSHGKVDPVGGCVVCMICDEVCCADVMFFVDSLAGEVQDITLPRTRI
jgi:hypothetical protein